MDLEWPPEGVTLVLACLREQTKTTPVGVQPCFLPGKLMSAVRPYVHVSGPFLGTLKTPGSSRLFERQHEDPSFKSTNSRCAKESITNR